MILSSCTVFKIRFAVSPAVKPNLQGLSLSGLDLPGVIGSKALPGLPGVFSALPPRLVMASARGRPGGFAWLLAAAFKAPHRYSLDRVSGSLSGAPSLPCKDSIALTIRLYHIGKSTKN